MKTSADKTSQDLKRQFYLIRYYESCRANYTLYSTKNPEAIKLTTIECRLQRLVAEAREMINAGIAHDTTKLPRSLRPADEAVVA